MKNNYKVITKNNCNYKVYTRYICNNKVITFIKRKYKVITKVFTYYIVITFLSPALAVTFTQPLTDGQLAFGTVDKNEKVFIENNYLNIGKQNKNLFQIPTDPNGRFVIGIPQDAQNLNLTVQYPGYSKQVSFPIHPRQWNEEIVKGLPPAKVQPSSQNQKRITAEASSMKEARQKSEFPEFPESWVCPVPGYTRVSSQFGSRRILNHVKKQGHSGMDLAAPVGTPIIAPANGKVVFIHPDMFLTGKTVLIDHGFGVFSSYSHLNEINIKLNQLVKQGDLLGKVGQTGRATGPHLHWTVTWYGVRVNPADLISFK